MVLMVLLSSHRGGQRLEWSTGAAGEEHEERQRLHYAIRCEAKGAGRM